VDSTYFDAVAELALLVNSSLHRGTLSPGLTVTFGQGAQIQTPEQRTNLGDRSPYDYRQWTDRDALANRNCGQRVSRRLVTGKGRAPTGRRRSLP
jgi:hypothetical protein